MKSANNSKPPTRRGCQGIAHYTDAYDADPNTISALRDIRIWDAQSSGVAESAICAIY
jgi:hypothetical protein